MSLVQRLIRNASVNMLGLSMNAILQLLTVPLLTSVWSLHQYGTWVILTTIPTYLALSDLGFTTAATSEMTMLYSRGNKTEARAIYHGIWTLLTALSAALTLVAAPLLFLTHVSMPSGFEWMATYCETIFLFVLYSAVALCSRVPLAGFRSAGQYATGTFCYDSLCSFEALVMLAVAWLGGTFDACVLAGTVCRAFSIYLLNRILSRIVPGMHLGYANAHTSELLRLLYPAVTAMTIPIALAVNIQGIVLVVGAVLSPQAVAVLNPVRTASRIALQLVSTLNRGSVPEMSRAASTNNPDDTKKLLLLNAVSVLLVLLPGALVFAIYGADIVRVWTFGRISPPPVFVAIMAAAMLLQGTWYFCLNLLVSVNKHASIAKYMVISSITLVAMAFPAGAWLGLEGIAGVVAATEAICLVATMRVFLRYFHPYITIRSASTR